MSTSSFVCPYCDTEFQVPDDAWHCTCSHCAHHLDLDSQFAYLRGLAAFSEGQEIMAGISPRQRRKPFHPIDKQAMELFMEAYTALQVAFRAELEESQRALGIEMMASMANEFMKRNMVSTFEANYWSSLLVELNSRNEYDRIKAKFVSLKGPFSLFMRLRWQTRQKQLLKALAELEARLLTLEKAIEFIDVPRARNKKWRP